MELGKAIVLAREIADALGGEQAEALYLLCRIVEGHHRRPSQQLEAAADHFRAARAELDDGKE